MKRYFFLAVAALSMMTACEKNGPDQFVDPSQDDKVAISFGVQAPGATVTQTKAALNGNPATNTGWNNNEVYVYGFTSDASKTLGSGRYDVTTPYINAVKATAQTGYSTLLSVTTTDPLTGQTVPYYYSNNDTYDFYGYHLGGAEATTAITNVTDVITIPVTIDGTDDLMYAKADQETDIQKAIDAGETNISAADTVYAYSAWAARRGVHPTLKFQHALTRFNIKIKGSGTSSETVKVDTIATQSIVAGNLTVVGAELGWKNQDAATAQSLTLKKADGSLADAIVVDDGVSQDMGDCFMVAPDMTTIKFTVKSSHKPTTAQNYIKLPNTEITLTPDMINPALTKFEAGYMYNVTIIVYGPEEIKITAELAPWLDGGEYVYDPDEEMKPETPVASTINSAVSSFIINEETYNSLLAGTNYITQFPWTSDIQTMLPWLHVKFDQIVESEEIYVQILKDESPIQFSGAEGTWDASASALKLSGKHSFVMYECKARGGNNFLGLTATDSGKTLTVKVKTKEMTEYVTAANVTIPTLE